MSADRDVQISLLDRVEALVPVLADDPAFAAWRINKSSVLRLALQEGLARLEKYAYRDRVNAG